MNSVRGLLVLVGMSLAAPALAVQFSVGGTLGQFDYDNVDDGSGLRISLSQTFSNSLVYWEAGYFDTGKGDVQVTMEKLKFSGYSAALGYRVPFNAAKPNASAGFVKGGLYSGEFEEQSPTLNAQDRSAGVMLGVGADWVWVPGTIGARVQYEILFDVDDFADNRSINLLSLGLVFGGPSPAGAVSRPASTPADDPAPAPAPAAQAAEAPAEAPAESVAEVPAAAAPPSQPVIPPPSEPAADPNDPYSRVIGTAYAVRGASLRVSPTPTAKVQIALPANVAVQLRARIINATGLWWYGSIGGERGWIQASQLTPTAQ